MAKEQSYSSIGYKAIMVFLIIGGGFYYLLQRPLRASNWDKTNLISCAKLTNQEVLCKHRYSAIFGLFPENAEFRLREVNIQKYDGGEDPNKYIVQIKTDNKAIMIDDYGDDYERAYKNQQLLRSILHENEISTVKLEYADGLTKSFSIGLLSLFSLGLSSVICKRL